jgi:predicted hydrocarbon binding protein
MTNADQQDDINVDNDVTEETYEPEAPTDESSEVSEEPSSEETSDDTIQVSRSEYEKYKREAFAAKRLREKRTEGSKESNQAPALDQELISRTFLAAQAGITDKEVQNEALRLAQKFGMNIAEALDDADVMTRIKNLQKQKQTQQAIAKQTGGSASRTKDIGYYIAKFKETGDFPAGTPSSMIAKVTMALANES